MKCSHSEGWGSQALQSSSGVATMFFQVCIFPYLIAVFWGMKEGWKTKSLLWVWCNVFSLSSSPTELDKEVWRRPVLFLRQPMISEAFKDFMKLKSSKVVLKLTFEPSIQASKFEPNPKPNPNIYWCIRPNPHTTAETVFLGLFEPSCASSGKMSVDVVPVQIPVSGQKQETVSSTVFNFYQRKAGEKMNTQFDFGFSRSHSNIVIFFSLLKITMQ